MRFRGSTAYGTGDARCRRVEPLPPRGACVGDGGRTARTCPPSVRRSSRGISKSKRYVARDGDWYEFTLVIHRKDPSGPELTGEIRSHVWSGGPTDDTAPRVRPRARGRCHDAGLGDERGRTNGGSRVLRRDDLQARPRYLRSGPRTLQTRPFLGDARPSAQGAPGRERQRQRSQERAARVPPRAVLDRGAHDAADRAAEAGASAEPRCACDR
jgi:hypothetical protein